MKRLCHEPYNKENLKTVVSKYDSVGDLRSMDPDAYAAILRLDLLVELTSHLSRKRFYWSDEDLFLEAKNFTTHGEFKEKSRSAYFLCVDRKVLDIACSHMFRSGNVSSHEFSILSSIKPFFPDAKRHKTNKVRIEGKPHIKGFEIDILIPSLNKGIEFDGTYYHSLEGLKRSRPHWPNEDLRSYHDLKDNYFLTVKGIEILHIKEENWLNNRLECIDQIEKFLGITNFMSEPGQKVA
jgi:hypothetical protein